MLIPPAPPQRRMLPPPDDTLEALERHVRETGALLSRTREDDELYDRFLVDHTTALADLAHEYRLRGQVLPFRYQS